MVWERSVLGTSVLFLIALINAHCLANPYFRIPIGSATFGESVGDNLLLPDIGDKRPATTEWSGGALRDDCRRLINLYDRLRLESRVMALLIRGHTDDRVLESCARLLLSSSQSLSLLPLAPTYDISNLVAKRSEESAQNGQPVDLRLVQRQAYDYIRFGKRLIEEANKRMQLSKNGSKKLETHEYIRFGKK